MATMIDPALRPIENKLDEGIPLSKEDGVALLRTRDLHTLGRLAKRAKERKSGRKVFYVLNRYINSTNVCYAGCKFCSFARGEKEEGAVRMSADEVLAKAFETGTNFNQLHIVGGHDPRQLSLDYWLPLMRRFKNAVPHVQLSLLTAAEMKVSASASGSWSVRTRSTPRTGSRSTRSPTASASLRMRRCSTGRSRHPRSASSPSSCCANRKSGRLGITPLFRSRSPPTATNSTTAVGRPAS